MGVVVSMSEAKRLQAKPPIPIDELDDWTSYRPTAPKTGLTFGEWWLLDHRHLKKVKSRSLRSILDAVKRLPPSVLELELEEITYQDVIGIFRWLESRKKPDGRTRYAATTIHLTYDLFSGILARAVQAGALAFNPAQKRPACLPPNRPGPEYKAKAQVISAPQLSGLLSSSEIWIRHRMIYALAAFLGLRIGEAIGATWGQWDEAFAPVLVGDKEIVLGRFLVRWQWIEGGHGETKTNESRELPVLPDLSRLLQIWREDAWPGVHSRRHRRRPGPDDLIVPGLYHGKLTGRDPRQVRREFKEDLARAGISPRTFQSLRKSFVTLSINAGAEEAAIFSLTHRDRSIKSVYRHWHFDRVAREVLKFPVKLELERRQLELFERE